MTMLEVVKAKWCESLEDLLECPVCNEIPKKYIYQCRTGHHICRDCRNKVTECPICTDFFGYARNYLAEELSEKFEDIMTSLMYPTHKINKHILKNKLCVQTQTQEICKESVETQTNSIFSNKDKFTQTKKIPISKNAKVCMQAEGTMNRRGKQRFYPKIRKGNYPCCIGSCTSFLSHGKMIKHLQSSHSDTFFIFQETSGIFQKKSELKYIVPKCHDLAFLINNMGLFFVNIRILPTGNLTGAVYVVNNASASKQFTFVLMIGNGQKATSYYGMVKSCRESHIQTMDNCLFKNVIGMREILLPNGNFNCSLTIARLAHQV